MRVENGLAALTEKEKQTLRLIVRGHDAKSIARSLDLSVHTINERLRDARRKMAVTSSREAARLLLEAEGDLVSPIPKSLGDIETGDGAIHAGADGGTAPLGGVGRMNRRSWISIGVLLMLFALGLLALTALPQSAPTPPPPPTYAGDTPNPEVVESARRWLTLVDDGQWADSYRETGAPFRKLNTEQVWAAASEKVRVPLGTVISRTFVSQENVPAPPSSYELVKFRTSFTHKADAIETVSLDHEDGRWRVVGVTIG